MVSKVFPDEPNYAHSTEHGTIDPLILSTEKGKKAIKVSFLGLAAIASVQVVIALISGSSALLADTFHSLSDAVTAVPLWIAFSIANRKPDKRFTYGYGRAEDVAGLAIVFLILISALFAAYNAIRLILEPATIAYVEVVAIAGIVGFAGNEMIAQYRIRTGREIGSAALIADGYHARTDGLTSLAVVLGAIGVWLGYPLADPVVAILITLAILKVFWDSGKLVFGRLMDSVDPEVVDDIIHAIGHIEGVMEIADVKVRWIGHRMHAEITVIVDSGLSVSEGHDITIEVRESLTRHVTYLSGTTIHVEPLEATGKCSLQV
ncbi:cation diffusion facilitator family transporter [Methanolobus chelungpuianus]|uniref:cation diffusion facilitator family transporter n=1 Tax=Methanolobus chelungpuianus TaxID=502115 RepID=UPI002114F25A|nr:cation diffusion facilitator family transporter [Methanolobus chelungpuianus]